MMCPIPCTCQWFYIRSRRRSSAAAFHKFFLWFQNGFPLSCVRLLSILDPPWIYPYASFIHPVSTLYPPFVHLLSILFQLLSILYPALAHPHTSFRHALFLSPSFIDPFSILDPSFVNPSPPFYQLWLQGSTVMQNLFVDTSFQMITVEKWTAKDCVHKLALSWTLTSTPPRRKHVASVFKFRWASTSPGDKKTVKKQRLAMVSLMTPRAKQPDKHNRREIPERSVALHSMQPAAITQRERECGDWERMQRQSAKRWREPALRPKSVMKCDKHIWVQ